LNFDTTNLVVNVFAGIVGMAYFMYGKKQQKLVPLISGVGLCVLPYVIDNNTALICVCVGLAIAPFVIHIDL
jgi:hypothetical protein